MKAALVQRFNFIVKIEQRDFTIVVQRTNSPGQDQVVFHFDVFQQQAPSNELTAQLTRLYHLFHTKLGGISPQQVVTETLGKDLELYYQTRDAELIRLQDAIRNAQETLVRQTAEERGRLDDEYRKRREELEAEASRTREQEKQEFEKRKAELDKRAETMDASDARLARRRLREDLKKELSRRSEVFALTSGTIRKRRPVDILCFVLMAIFATGLACYLYVGVSTQETAGVALHQASFGLAFLTTAVFYFRWNSAWFRQHAQEEFRQKRLELDVDRASWVVEMALEWKEQAGAELPTQLLERLTSNLFVPGEPLDATPHPADQFASALLGISTRGTFNFPGGSVEVDKKGLQQIGKASE